MLNLLRKRFCLAIHSSTHAERDETVYQSSQTPQSNFLKQGGDGVPAAPLKEWRRAYRWKPLTWVRSRSIISTQGSVVVLPQAAGAGREEGNVAKADSLPAGPVFSPAQAGAGPATGGSELCAAAQGATGSEGSAGAATLVTCPESVTTRPEASSSHPASASGSRCCHTSAWPSAGLTPIHGIRATQQSLLACAPSAAGQPEGEDAPVLLSVLGEGTYGCVYKASWKGTLVAVKVMRLPPSMDGNEKREKMAIMETAISSSLSHPNVVQTFTYSVQQVQQQGPRCPDTKSVDLPSLAEVDGEGGAKLGAWDKPEGGSSWEVRLVQEYCEAGSLREMLDKKAFHPPGRDVDLCAVLDTAIDVARALDHLHRQGIVHADLKPRNVLLKANPLVQRGFVAKVADFGLSVKVAPGKDHVDGVVQGTLSHMAPETLLHGHLGPPADVYAFGIMLWELMTAQRAYRGLPKTLIAHAIAHEELRPSFPPTAPATLAALASDCWAARPEARPPFPVILAELTAYRAMMFGQEHAGDVSGSLALLTLSAHHLLLPPPQQPYHPAAAPHLPLPSTRPQLGRIHSRALASTPGAARGAAGQRLSDDGQGQLGEFDLMRTAPLPAATSQAGHPPPTIGPGPGPGPCLGPGSGLDTEFHPRPTAAAEWVERSAQRTSLMLQRQFPASTGAAAANPEMAGGCQGWQSVRA
ncbi:hypothetical protein QJQ45_016559, partial [Haematococcus lacustris]